MAEQPPEGPKRPETVRSAVSSWAQSPDMVSQETSARNAIKNAAQMQQQQRQPDPPAQKQPEKTDQMREKENAIREQAQKFAPKAMTPEQQREQELQKQKEQERGR